MNEAGLIFVVAVLGMLGAFLFGFGLGIDTGRVQVASGQYECAQDIAGEWRCREVE